MKTILSALIFILIAIMVMQNQLFAAVLLAGWFTWRVGAFLLLPLAIMLDGYFGAFYDVPVITLCAIAWYGVSEFVRPRLLMHYKEYEKA
ncbi:MAG: hypothetical protein RL538_429 [Candidatus Parcubacteria bacterium]|jgi:hypothetical protein